MHRLHEWLKRHKTKALLMTTAILAIAILPLLTTGCSAGRSSNESTERPKSPYELESMIESDKADIQGLKGDIEGINTLIIGIQSQQAKDWTADINAIKNRLDAIEAALLPHPTAQPTQPGGQPFPTQPPSGSLTLTYTGDTDVEFLDEEAEPFNVKVTNTGSATKTKVRVTLTKLSSNADIIDPIGFQITVPNNDDYVDLIYSPYTTGLDCTKIVAISKDIDIASGIVIVPITITLNYNDDPTQKWWSISFSLQ